MEPVIPSVITPEQAADALGLTVQELAENISGAIEGRLRKLAAKVGSFEAGELSEFADEVDGIKRLYEAELACWAAIDAAAEEVEN